AVVLGRGPVPRPLRVREEPLLAGRLTGPGVRGALRRRAECGCDRLGAGVLLRACAGGRGGLGNVVRLWLAGKAELVAGCMARVKALRDGVALGDGTEVRVREAVAVDVLQHDVAAEVAVL